MCTVSSGLAVCLQHGGLLRFLINHGPKAATIFRPTRYQSRLQGGVGELLYIKSDQKDSSSLKFWGNQLKIPCDMSSTRISAADITTLVSKAGLKLEDGHAEGYSALTNEFDDLVARLGDDKLLFPSPDLSKYPRTGIHIPSPKDTDGGGWATRVSSLVASPVK